MPRILDVPHPHTNADGTQVVYNYAEILTVWFDYGTTPGQPNCVIGVYYVDIDQNGRTIEVCTNPPDTFVIENYPEEERQELDEDGTHGEVGAIVLFKVEADPQFDITAANMVSTEIGQSGLKINAIALWGWLDQYLSDHGKNNPYLGTIL